MPLQGGSGHETIGKNIAELVRKYKESGKIGNASPKNLHHAVGMAAAIAYGKARSGKKK